MQRKLKLNRLRKWKNLLNLLSKIKIKVRRERLSLRTDTSTITLKSMLKTMTIFKSIMRMSITWPRLNLSKRRKRKKRRSFKKSELLKSVPKNNMVRIKIKLKRTIASLAPRVANQKVRMMISPRRLEDTML
jgi:hypothetical protein